MSFLNTFPSGSGGGGGHEIEDNAGTALTQRNVMQFGGDFEATDDSTNEKTVVEPHELTSGEFAEIFSTLPGEVKNDGIIIDERGTEYEVGTWINSDGTKQPLYEAVFKGTTPSSTTIINLAPANNRTRCHMVWGYYTDSSGYNADLNYDELTTGYGIACAVKSDGTQASFSVGGYSSNRPFIICVRYTKSTDTPS